MSAVLHLASLWSFKAELEPEPDMARCLIRGCGHNHHSIGLCLRHYQQHQYWADPERARAKRRARYARKKGRAGTTEQAA